MLNLTEFRRKAIGLPDMLPWGGLFGNGIVLLKSGGLMAGFEFHGPDLDSSTRSELRSMAERLNSALKLGDGWVIHCDVVRDVAPGYPPQGAFPDRTTRLIDDARRAAHEGSRAGYASRHILCLTWFPMPDSANRAADVFVEGRITAGAERAVERFRDAIQEIEGRLGSLVKIRRLVDRVDDRTGAIESELLAHLDQCVSMGNWRPFRLSAVPMYLDSVVGCHDMTTGFQPKIGKKHISAISFVGLPGYSVPGILDFVGRMPVSCRWSSRFIFMDPGKAGGIINKYRGKWAMKRKSLLNLLRENGGGQSTHVDADADRMTNDAIAAYGEASSGHVQFGYYSSTLLLAHEDLAVLDEVTREVAKEINNAGFGARIEDLNAVEAYLGTMPGNTSANVRRPIIHTLNLAHLLPMTMVWAGPQRCECPFYPKDSPALMQTMTSGNTPFRLSLHSGDLGHTEILGPTGAGKSTLLASLVAQQFRYPRAQVFVFDKGYSMFPLVKAAGGEHYDVAGPGMDLAFCPLGRIDHPSELVWAAEWVEGLAELQGMTVTPSARQEIFRALTQLAKSTAEARERTITNLLIAIQDGALRDALRAYTLQGMAGSLLDAEVDALAEDRFQVFEMEHLMQKGEKVLLPVLLYLFHRLAQRFDGRPTLLVLDEAWVMLGHPVFREKLREWLKTLRKANVAVVLATQSLSDMARSGIADVVHESCPTKILLPNPEAGTESSRPMYQAIGLNSRQIEILSTAIPKRQYYVIQLDGRRLFELGLSPTELAFVGSSGKEDIMRIRQLIDEFGDSWPAAWLRERGLAAAAARWETYV